jgi:hypothetical protein
VDEVRVALAAGGFCLGLLVMWWYLNAVGLLRTRREYYAARRAEGEEVPGDCDDDDV